MKFRIFFLGLWIGMVLRHINLTLSVIALALAGITGFTIEIINVRKYIRKHKDCKPAW